MLERRVEFSLLTYAFEDGGPTLVQLTEVSEPLLQRAQLGVIERPGRLLPVTCDKWHGRSAVEQRDSGSDLLLADAQFLGDAQIRAIRRLALRVADIIASMAAPMPSALEAASGS